MVVLFVAAVGIPVLHVHTPARRATALPVAQLPEPVFGPGLQQVGMDQNQAVFVSFILTCTITVNTRFTNEEMVHNFQFTHTHTHTHIHTHTHSHTHTHTRTHTHTCTHTLLGVYYF